MPTGAQSAETCPAGTFWSSESSVCQPCAPGTYSDHVGAAECVNCESGRFSPSVGAASATTCQTCPEAFSCSRAGMAYPQLSGNVFGHVEVLPGYGGVALTGDVFIYAGGVLSLGNGTALINVADDGCPAYSITVVVGGRLQLAANVTLTVRSIVVHDNGFLQLAPPDSLNSSVSINGADHCGQSLPTVGVHIQTGAGVSSPISALHINGLHATSQVLLVEAGVKRFTHAEPSTLLNTDELVFRELSVRPGGDSASDTTAVYVDINVRIEGGVIERYKRCLDLRQSAHLADMTIQRCSEYAVYGGYHNGGMQLHGCKFINNAAATTVLWRTAYLQSARVESCEFLGSASTTLHLHMSYGMPCVVSNCKFVSGSTTDQAVYVRETWGPIEADLKSNLYQGFSAPVLRIHAPRSDSVIKVTNSTFSGNSGGLLQILGGDLASFVFHDNNVCNISQPEGTFVVNFDGTSLVTRNVVGNWWGTNSSDAVGDMIKGAHNTVGAPLVVYEPIKEGVVATAGFAEVCAGWCGYGHGDDDVLCPAGHYRTVAGSTSDVHCLLCAPGHSAKAGSTSCTSCPVGTFAEGIQNSTASRDEFGCTYCAPGRFSDAVGATENSTCSELCPVGSACPLGVRNPCSPGTYSDHVGAAECVNCESGRFSPSVGASSATTCQTCPEAFSCSRAGMAYPQLSGNVFGHVEVLPGYGSVALTGDVFIYSGGVLSLGNGTAFIIAVDDGCPAYSITVLDGGRLQLAANVTLTVRSIVVYANAFLHFPPPDSLNSLVTINAVDHCGYSAPTVGLHIKTGAGVSSPISALHINGLRATSQVLRVEAGVKRFTHAEPSTLLDMDELVFRELSVRPGGDSASDTTAVYVDINVRIEGGVIERYKRCLDLRQSAHVANMTIQRCSEYAVYGASFLGGLQVRGCKFINNAAATTVSLARAYLQGARVESCEFHGSASTTVHLYIESRMPSVVSNCKFVSGSATDQAVYVREYYGAEADLKWNLYQGFSAPVLRMYAPSSDSVLKVTYSTFSGNSGGLLQIAGGDLASFVFHDNNVCNVLQPEGTFVVNFDGTSLVTRNVVGNWWGTNSSDAVGDMIKGAHNTVGAPLVVYEPIKEGVVATAGFAEVCTGWCGYDNGDCICPAGHYRTYAGSTSDVDCLLCAPGHGAKAGTTNCSSCPVGTFAEGIQNSTASRDEFGCTYCAPGRFSDAVGATDNSTCSELCPVGSACPLGVRNPCSPGTYSDHVGAAECVDCEPGRFSPSVGASSATTCQTCPEAFSCSRAGMAYPQLSGNVFGHVEVLPGYGSVALTGDVFIYAGGVLSLGNGTALLIAADDGCPAYSITVLVGGRLQLAANVTLTVRSIVVHADAFLHFPPPDSLNSSVSINGADHCGHSAPTVGVHIQTGAGVSSPISALYINGLRATSQVLRVEDGVKRFTHAEPSTLLDMDELVFRELSVRPGGDSASDTTAVYVDINVRIEGGVIERYKRCLNLRQSAHLANMTIQRCSEYAVYVRYNGGGMQLHGCKFINNAATTTVSWSSYRYSARVESCEFHGSASTTLHLYIESRMSCVVSNCKFVSGSATDQAVYVRDPWRSIQADLKSNLYQGFSAPVLRIDAPHSDSVIKVTNSTFSGNSGGLFEILGGDLPSFVFHDNNVCNISQPEGTFVVDFDGTSLVTRNVVGNWWGTTSSDAVGDMIKGAHNTVGAPLVVYEPIKEGVLTTAGFAEVCTGWCGHDNGGCDDLVSCSPIGQSVTCGTCPSGFSGDGSTKGGCVDIDECATDEHQCREGSTCVNMAGSYSCACPEGYDGALCMNNIDDCAPTNPCQNGGTCTDGVASFTCNCITGFTGDLCNVNIDDCDPSPCEHGGTCTDLVNDYNCILCDTGWEGKSCEINTDDCTPNPCEHGGVCEDHVNNFTCSQCDPGWQGHRCHINIDDCALNPCENGATCVDELLGYHCDCAPNWHGANCTVFDPCHAGTCQNGGSCELTPDGLEPICTCRLGFSGDRCETNVNECVDNPCGEHGVCFDGVADYRCTCDDGWDGRNCSVNATATSATACADCTAQPGVVVVLAAGAVGVLLLILCGWVCMSLCLRFRRRRRRMASAKARHRRQLSRMYQEQEGYRGSNNVEYDHGHMEMAEL